MPYRKHYRFDELTKFVAWANPAIKISTSWGNATEKENDMCSALGLIEYYMRGIEMMNRAEKGSVGKQRI